MARAGVGAGDTGVVVEALGNDLVTVSRADSPKSQRFVSYTFRLTLGGESWEVRRRFSDFKAMKGALKGSDEVLPESGWGRSFEPRRVLQRQNQLEQYLNAVVKQSHLWNQDALREFCAVSRHSFVSRLGFKGVEGWCRKASGSCVAGRFAVFKRRWIIAKDCFIAWFVSPEAEMPSGVLLVDGDFVLHETAVPHHAFALHISCGARALTLAFSCAVEAEDWRAKLKALYNPAACPRRNPKLKRKGINSFAPYRENCQATMHVGGRELFAAMAHAIWSAREEIFLAGWIFNANVLLVRPPDAPTGTGGVRLDELLRLKAAQGVQIYALLYREVSDAHQVNPCTHRSRDSKLPHSSACTTYPPWSTSHA